MKTPSLLSVLLSMLVCTASAIPPKLVKNLPQTLTVAAQEKKLAFVLLGRPECEYCNATKAMIKEGKIPVTDADYVMTVLNIDEQKTQDEFMSKYGREKFGDTLPFVVVTDSRGKALVASGGLKSVEQWNTMLATAKQKASK